MIHHVFISHSAKDKAKADAVCAALESRSIQCWVASRNIRPGADWGKSIIDAISKSRVMVLILSSSANDSPQVKREVERAVNKEIVVVPLRVEDVQPSGALEYFLSTQHWIDASTPPLEKHLEQIAESIKVLLEDSATESEQEQLEDSATETEQEQIAEPIVSRCEAARSIPRQVHSLKEVEALSQNGKVLLITFAAAESGEHVGINELESWVFPIIKQFVESEDISICYARAKGTFLNTAIGNELKQLSVGALGVFLFHSGRLADHRKLSYLVSKDFYINTLQQLFGVEFHK
jgi:hypothetical protein